MAKKKIVLAYSGGLDTSVILRWLIDKYDAEIIAYTADVGQGEELAPLEKKALDSGASKIYIEDLREEFVRDYVWPCLKADAIYEKGYMLGTSIARPITAKRMIEIAEKEGAYAVAHGATGKGNDQVRFELTVFALAPHLKVIAPWRIWNFKSRTDLIKYTQEKGIPITVTEKKPYSSDRNLLHISFEGGILEDTTCEPDEDMFILTDGIDHAPESGETVEIGFESGLPVSINGKTMKPVELLETTNALGKRHAIGRVDIVENRLVGMKSRGVYETPGGTILYQAHRELEQLCLDRKTLHHSQQMSVTYAELVYNGEWFSPLKESLDAYFNNVQETVTGTVKLLLKKGNIISRGKQSPNSLYDPELATFESDHVYNQADAQGFINLFGLPLKVRGMKRK